MHPMFDIPDDVMTIVTSILASTGLWAMLTSQFHEKKSAKNNEKEVIRGIAHAEIVRVGKQLLHKGYVTLDDLNEFDTYLCQPYFAMGGNGYAKEIYNQVMKLPIHYEDIGGDNDSKKDTKAKSEDGKGNPAKA